MFPHILNKAHPSKGGRLIQTNGIRIKDGGSVVVFKDFTRSRGDDSRELARLRREARELLKEIERDEAMKYARAMLEAVDVLNS